MTLSAANSKLSNIPLLAPSKVLMARGLEAEHGTGQDCDSWSCHLGRKGAPGPRPSLSGWMERAARAKDTTSG